jgi:hypothetical protein
MTCPGTRHSNDYVLKGITAMTRKLLLLAGLVVTLTGRVCVAQPAPQGEAFDVLGAVMDNSRKQLSAKQVLNRNKEDAETFREKIIAGWWEFMQANSKARPGEYCAAMFQRARREAHPGGIDLFTGATTVTLFGPGGDYRGALLAFSPLDKEHKFPKLQNGQKVLITLKQGDEPPQTLNALYFTLGKSAAPMIAFAVPSVDALLASIEDLARFELHYQGRVIASIEWHSGFKARDGLQACLKGKR